MLHQADGYLQLKIEHAVVDICPLLYNEHTTCQHCNAEQEIATLQRCKLLTLLNTNIKSLSKVMSSNDYVGHRTVLLYYWLQ